MVYLGKPSKGCQMCRIRRIKCDETKPTCLQCTRARKKCPGYRSEDELMAKNKTADQRGKREAHANRPIAPKHADPDVDVLSDSSSPASSSVILPTDETITTLLQLPLEDLAPCHFVANYVLSPRQEAVSSRGFFEFLPSLMRGGTPSPHFRHAFESCALASLNNRVGNGNEFNKQALGCYTKALAATFGALKNPEVAKRDETLAAILLLSFFENITAKSMGMLAWSSHIEGAIQLVKVRGPGQLKTKIGVDMFVAVRTQMIIHCSSTGKAPDPGVQWWAKGAVSEGYSSQSGMLGCRTGELRHRINDLLTYAKRTPEELKLVKQELENCHVLDDDIVQWLANLLRYCDYEAAAWEDFDAKRDYSKAETFPGRVDAYQDLWIVNVWNTCRCMRIVLASLVMRLTAWIINPADYRTTPEYSAMSKICVEAITDIIASVPFQLGWFSKHKDLRDQAPIMGYACGEDDAEKGLVGYFLLWPLTCIQGQDYLTDLQRTWVKGRLKCIGNDLGVRYGNMLSQLNIRVPSMLIMRDRLKNNPHDLTVYRASLMAGPPTTASSGPDSVSSLNAADRREDAYKRSSVRRID